MQEGSNHDIGLENVDTVDHSHISVIAPYPGPNTLISQPSPKLLKNSFLTAKNRYEQ